MPDASKRFFRCEKVNTRSEDEDDNFKQDPYLADVWPEPEAGSARMSLAEISRVQLKAQHYSDFEIFRLEEIFLTKKYNGYGSLPHRPKQPNGITKANKTTQMNPTVVERINISAISPY